MNYFENFPVFVYSNTACVNITERVVIANTIQQDLFAYFPYEMKHAHRADSIADRYYGDSSFDWLVYMSNKIVDPYYELPLDDHSFPNFINAKYGNFPNAQQKILFWQVSWANNTDDQLDVGTYTNTLPEPQKKYYEAVYGEGTRILYYRRRRVDWQASTNMVQYFQITNPVGTFQPEEVVTLSYGNTIFSNSYVTFANSSQITVQHVMGNTTPGNVELTTDGNFASNPVSGSPNTFLNGWEWTNDGGGGLLWTGNSVNLFGDASFPVWFFTTIPTVSGQTYTITINTSGSTLNALKIGTSQKNSSLGNYTSIATGNTTHQFTAIGSTTWISFSQTSGATVILNSISVTGLGQFTITGLTSGATASWFNTVFVANNIPVGESQYWSPVYAYDYEVGLNEQKKHIRLIDSKYSLSIANKLRKDLQA